MDKFTAALGRSPKTIAVFRAIKLGDLLVTVPALRALRRAFPKAHITLISLPWAKDFVVRFPEYIDEAIAFPGWPGLPEQPLNPAEIVAFLGQMQQRQFDVVLQMQGNGTLVNPMIELLGAKVTAGYYPAELKQYCSNADFWMPYPTDEHEVKRHVRLMEFLGIPAQGYDLEFPITAEDESRALENPELRDLKAGQYACIHAGGISARRWPESHFAQVANALTDWGYQIVLTGTASEAPMVEKVISQLKEPAINLAGKTDLGVIGWVLSRAALLVSNDTGVSHIAAGLKTPSVVIYTTSKPEEWGPLNNRQHRAVLEREATDPRRVIDEALDLVTGVPAEPSADN